VKRLRIVTRQSKLAIWQAEFVAAELQRFHPDIAISIKTIKTQGDKILNLPLAKIGGKGLFVKELEYSLLEESADIAVHCMKDIPVQLLAGLQIATILKRDDPRDVLVSAKGYTVDSLPHKARVGTSSLRRQAQLLRMRPDLQIIPLRGNIDTRLNKLITENFDAIVLAAAGLQRLQFLEKYNHVFLDEMLPAVGQGALGLECRTSDIATQEIIAVLHDIDTANCILAERSMNVMLEGGCEAPIGGFAFIANDSLVLQGLVASIDGQTLIQEKMIGAKVEAEQLGKTLGSRLLSKGAKTLLADLQREKRS